MSFLKQYLIPIIIFAVFFFTLVLVSSRAFLPNDMTAPAPIGSLNLISPSSELLNG
ncbi:hypothetical protein Pse7367_0938 [Thalassoporum mexicanum PCC 7367]|uniref:hypothetical protein n=1 Tax=Thalassoporum mexicanum TaxID=3457544 RepID=UPI00029FDB42|nr:hypothetical protein [Pseudanabaena sp. PCC 7367]AFY69238.1 hypothetical protein Pse7367_0938 [Pseudanabaena sp. PCC 7367]